MFWHTQHAADDVSTWQMGDERRRWAAMGRGEGGGEGGSERCEPSVCVLSIISCCFLPGFSATATTGLTYKFPTRLIFHTIARAGPST